MAMERNDREPLLEAFSSLMDPYSTEVLGIISTVLELRLVRHIQRRARRRAGSARRAREGPAPAALGSQSRRRSARSIALRDQTENALCGGPLRLKGGAAERRDALGGARGARGGPGRARLPRLSVAIALF